MSESAANNLDQRLLAALLGRLIPASADGRLPGASEPAVVARFLQALDAEPTQAATLTTELAALEARAMSNNASAFADLEEAAQIELLEAWHLEQPALFMGLLLGVAKAYYQEPSVLTALGLEARPPFPQGYEVPNWKPELLKPVQTLPPFFRKTV